MYGRRLFTCMSAFGDRVRETKVSIANRANQKFVQRTKQESFLFQSTKRLKREEKEWYFFYYFGWLEKTIFCIEEFREDVYLF